MTYEEIEREAANLIKKFSQWHPDDRQVLVQQVLIEVYYKGINQGIDTAIKKIMNWENNPPHPNPRLHDPTWKRDIDRM